MKPTEEKGNFNAAISCCFVLKVLFGSLRAHRNGVFPHGEIEKGCSMFSVPASCPTIIQLLLIIRVLLAVT